MKAYALAAAAVAAAAVVATAAADTGTQLYVPQAQQEAKQQIAKLIASGDREDAALLDTMASTAQAVWINGGSPNDARVLAQKTVNRAAGKSQLPVLVLYDLPFRDCGQYSAGGARSTAEYEAWIDGVAAGIGDGPALVILEPDGLGIIPYNTDINGTEEWCKPDLTGTGLTPETANGERYVQLNYAVDTLGRNAATRVYLDGTHPAWLGVGDIAQRLVKAGVQRAAGFFLNVSNYQYTTNSVRYGTWISQCIAQGDYAACPNQYWNGGPAGSMIADLLGAWQGVSLSPYGVWSDTATDPALNTSGYASRFWGTPTTHFVVDTSRNGLGPWQPPSGVYSDAQDWCNPPARGLGLRPTTDTGNALVDAYLWVKTPGQSDGSCTRGTAGPVDPEWNLVDPPAGAWFPEQALQLAQLANPPLNP
jgi:endoglucanase